MADHSILAPTEFIVRAQSSIITTMRDSCIPQTPLRNLHKEFMDVNDELQVFVRIKPTRDEECCLTTDGNHVVVDPPRDSVAFRNKNNSSKTVHKFKFNKIYDQNTTQHQLFKDGALSLVSDFLMGQNTLVFTYGATSAGKTYTMLGTVKETGILPRSLDAIFNSLEDRILNTPLLKPVALNEVMRLNADQTEAEEIERSLLMKGWDCEVSDAKDSISTGTSSGSVARDWNLRPRDQSVCPLQHPDCFYSVWVSYCEIYNEQAYDLLDVCDKRRKRVQLRVTEDRKGKFFVKGLREVCVRSSDEAFRVMLLGKENLRFAATKLNHNSSRSHCVFTVKVIRTDNAQEPTEAAVSLMSFCDLAGMERTTKTQSRGERLKEAGNINTSLLILGRCLETMRANNAQQNPLNKTIVPYRDSKLTKILQTFFSGRGRAAMFVSVSPTVTLCDETLHVLKFGALAQDTLIVPDTTVSNSAAAETSISLFAPPLRPSRFQQYVRKSISLISARASVLEPQPLSLAPAARQSTVATAAATAAAAAAASDRRIDELEAELAKLRAEWFDNEVKIRDECCAEWSAVVAGLEASWMRRNEETKARYEEFCDKRVNMLTSLMNKESMKKRKYNDSDDQGKENILVQLKDKEDRIESLEHTNERLNEVIEKLKTSLKVSEDGKSELQREMTRLQFEAAASSSAKPRINFFGPDLDEEEEASAQQAAQETDAVARLEAKLATKQALLDEAVIEFHNKNEELLRSTQAGDELRARCARLDDEVADLRVQLDKCNLLLSDANVRLDAREEELSSTEEQLLKITGQVGSLNAEVRDQRRKIRDLENRLALADAASTPAPKETRVGEKDASSVDSEVARFQDMAEDLQKQLLHAESRLDQVLREKQRLEEQERQDRDAAEQLETLRERFNKTQLQLSFARTLQGANDKLVEEKENLLDELCHLKKDLELSSSERQQTEAEKQQLAESNREMRVRQDELSKENAELRSTLAAFEATIGEMTTQLNGLQQVGRQRDLVEEELSTLAATLGRVNEDKNRLEKELAAEQRQAQGLQNQFDALNESHLVLQAELTELERQKSELNDQKVELERRISEQASAESQLERLDKIEKLKQQLAEAQQAAARERTEHQKLLRDLELKYDRLELDHEKLTKEMLQKMRLAQELQQQLDQLKEEMQQKTTQYDSLSARINQMETQGEKLKTVEMQLVDKEIALREKENKISSIIGTVEDKGRLVDELRQQLIDKDQEIERMQKEMKLLLSGHVNLRSTENRPLRIKTEKLPAEEELSQEEDHFAVSIVTPTPVKSRRGRPKKVASPGSDMKRSEGVDENVDAPRSRTKVSANLKPETPAPTVPRSVGRARKIHNKADEEAVAHPALSSNLHPAQQQDDSDVEPAAPTASSKRRLYNAKCPDILLPTKLEDEVGRPQRMSTRSRKT